MGPAKASYGDLVGSLLLSQECTIIFGPRRQSLNPALSSRSSCGARTGIIRCHCDVSTGLRFFQICHCAELNKIVEATMPVNPYDDRKVSLQRRYGNGDLDIVRASYTRHKANVTEALAPFICK